MQQEPTVETLKLTMDMFWEWLSQHPNCVLRAGTEQAVFYDYEELHWHLGRDPEGNYSLQVIRGKLMLGEMRIVPDEVAYVQPTAAEEDGQTLFEVFVRTPGEDEAFSGYHFLMAHGLEDEPLEDGDETSGASGSGHGFGGGHWSH